MKKNLVKIHVNLEVHGRKYILQNTNLQKHDKCAEFVQTGQWIVMCGPRKYWLQSVHQITTIHVEVIINLWRRNLCMLHFVPLNHAGNNTGNNFLQLDIVLKSRFKIINTSGIRTRAIEIVSISKMDLGCEKEYEIDNFPSNWINSHKITILIQIIFDKFIQS